MDAWIDKMSFGELTRIQQSGGMQSFNFSNGDKEQAKRVLRKMDINIFFCKEIDV